MRFRTLGFAVVTLALAHGTMSLAQSAPKLSQAMFVERIGDGGTSRNIERATDLRKGDRVILLVKWKSAAAGTSFTVSSAVPKKLAFERSSFRAQAVSVDGGRKWGRIGELTLSDAHGQRMASVEDVTHLRWNISAKRAAQGNGTITYSAIVR